MLPIIDTHGKLFYEWRRAISYEEFINADPVWLLMFLEANWVKLPCTPFGPAYEATFGRKIVSQTGRVRYLNGTDWTAAAPQSEGGIFMRTMFELETPMLNRWLNDWAMINPNETLSIEPDFINTDVPNQWLINALYGQWRKTFKSTKTDFLPWFCWFWSLTNMPEEVVVELLQRRLPGFTEEDRRKAVGRAVAAHYGDFRFNLWYGGIDTSLLPWQYSKSLVRVEDLKDRLSYGDYSPAEGNSTKHALPLSKMLRGMSRKQLQNGYFGGYSMPYMYWEFRYGL